MADAMDTDPGFTVDKFSMKAREGSTVKTGYMGTIQYQLGKLIFEERNPELHGKTGVFEGRRIDINTNEEVECVVKIRMQLNPALMGNGRRGPSSRESSWYFNRECRALRSSTFSGRTPEFIDSALEVQDHTGFYPGGYLHVIVMSKLPGKPISQLLGMLTEEDVTVIKKDLAVLLNYMYQLGYSLPVDITDDQHTYLGRPASLVIDENHVWYDQVSKSVYLSDLSRFKRHGTFRGGPQTEDIIMRSDFWRKLVANLPRMTVAHHPQMFTLCFRGSARKDDWCMVDATSSRA